jgi:hypothetical protein
LTSQASIPSHFPSPKTPLLPVFSFSTSAPDFPSFSRFWRFSLYYHFLPPPACPPSTVFPFIYVCRTAIAWPYSTFHLGSRSKANRCASDSVPLRPSLNSIVFLAPPLGAISLLRYSLHYSSH